MIQPFQDLVKKKKKYTHFVWTENLVKAFQQSKEIRVGLVKKGLTTFDINRVTCLAKKAWASCYCRSTAHALPKKNNILLLWWMAHCIFRQKILYQHRVPIYTHWGWSSCNHLGSKKKCCIFIMGCPNVIVVIDHQLLTGIFGDRELKVHNQCFFTLKKCLRYFFTLQHCPCKWHKGADAISCNPVATAEALISLCSTHRLSTERDRVLMNGRIVIPKSLMRKVLHCLHSADQGMDGMKAHTSDTFY